MGDTFGGSESNAEKILGEDDVRALVLVWALLWLSSSIFIDFTSPHTVPENEATFTNK